jgi:plastocyanin
VFVTRLAPVAATLAICFALAAGLLASCGGSSAARRDPYANGQYGGNPFLAETVPQQITVVADRRGSLRWDQTSYSAEAGDVSFVVQNPSPVPHQFGVEGQGLRYESGLIDPGTTVTLTIKGLPTGDYQIVCNFTNHKEAGMVAALAVR